MVGLVLCTVTFLKPFVYTNCMKKKIILKGAVIGGVIGLVFTFLFSFIKAPKFATEAFPEYLLFTFLIFILPAILCGAFVGFLSSLVKNKLIFIYGFIGGVVGLLIGSLPFTRYAHNFRWFAVPVGYLYALITGCHEEACWPVFFVYLVVSIFIFTLIGILFGFLINKIKERFSKK